MIYSDAVTDPAPISPLYAHWYRPLVPVVTAFCVAILAAEWSADHFLWAVGTIGMLAGGCVGLALRYARVRGLLLSTACTLVLGYAYAVWVAVNLPADHVSHHLSPTPVTLEGQVLRLAKVGPNRTTLDLSVHAL